MRKIVILSAIIATLGGATLAQARDSHVSCTATAAGPRLSIAELSAKFAAQGYMVRKIELKRGCGEADLLDRNGARTKVRFDPTNGSIVTRQAALSHQSRHHRDAREHRSGRDHQPYRRHRDDRL